MIKINVKDAEVTILLVCDLNKYLFPNLKRRYCEINC